MLPSICPNRHKSGHPAKLRLSHTGACADCGKQLTRRPARRIISNAQAIIMTTKQYDGRFHD